MGTANLFSVFMYVYSYLINGFYKLSTSMLALADIFKTFYKPFKANYGVVLKDA